MSEEVIIATRDRVVEVTFNRPDQGNAITPGMAMAVAASLTALPADTHAVVLCGAGADFCTGRAAVMPAPGTRATALELKALVADPVLDFYAMLRAVPVPVIAAVRGRALGVGCALAGLADVAIAADTAVFSVPEMDRDIAPTLVMTALADRLPRAALARLVMTRDSVSAAEAQALGVIGKVVAEAALEAEVARVLDLWRKNTPPVLRGVKAFLNAAPEMSFAVRREHAALINGAVTAERYR